MISGFCCSYFIQKQYGAAFIDLLRRLCIDRSGDSAQVGEESIRQRLDANAGKNLHALCKIINNIVIYVYRSYRKANFIGYL